MDKVFADIFLKHPDEIIDGDYFYYSPRFDAQDVTFAAMKGHFKVNSWKIKINLIYLKTG